MPWVGLQSVIVAFAGHTFLILISDCLFVRFGLMCLYNQYFMHILSLADAEIIY